MVLLLGGLVGGTVQAPGTPHLRYAISTIVGADWGRAYPKPSPGEFWDQAGVAAGNWSRARPDDGTLQLYAAAPQRIVPFLRP